MDYVIRPGDTLFALARRFNTTISAILRANPQITNPDQIAPGQRIVIPRNGPAPTGQCPLLRHGDRGPAVRRLQTLLRQAGYDPGAIDGIYGSRTQNALLALQRNTKELEISGVADPETWAALGVECELAPGTVKYTVRPGDSLYIIATRFNLTVAEILRVNPQITNQSLIYPGQVINLPVR